MPRLFIISGCNGAGKTTASYTMLPALLNLKTFVNADELSPQDPEREAIRASRLMMERVDQLILHGADLAVETTLATKSLAGVITGAQNQGYRVGLFYFWLKSPELAVKRVAIRAASGGHSVPEATIVRRYWQGMDNLRNIYLPICDNWWLIDNSTKKGKQVAEGGAGIPTFIHNRRTFNLILNPDNKPQQK